MSLPSAIPISFNRRLSASWLKEGLRLRTEGIRGALWEERMKELLTQEISGKDSLRKSMRYLKQIYLEDSPLVTDAVKICSSSSDPKRWELLSWGCSIVAYPFIGEVAAVVGRMLKLQSEFKLEQLLRRLTTSFGEKETVKRSGRYALGLIHDLGFVQRTGKAGCYIPGESVRIHDSQLAAWLVEAWLHGFQKVESMDRISLSGHPSFFLLDSRQLVDLALQSGRIEVSRQSYSQENLIVKRI